VRTFRVIITVVAALVALLCISTVAVAAQQGCGSLAAGQCGVTRDGDHFHGALAVTGSPWVLLTSSREGTTPGCGDCIWTVVLACPDESPTDPESLRACASASDSAICRPGRLLYRVYLTTAAFIDRVEGTVCLGGTDQPVPIGDVARIDVDRYLRDVTPPDLDIATRPTEATLAGLPTYFSASTPRTLAVVRFGGPTITEAITIAPTRVTWRWGDGSEPTVAPATAVATHAYRHGGVPRGSLATRWAATYTVTYDGQTLGPYDADRQLTRRQAFRLPVHTSSPVLVSR
jgi:hypothetical protein